MLRAFLTRALWQLRNLNAWLLLGIVFLLWPHLQPLLESYVGRERAPWLPLGNPASKLVATVLAVAVGYILMWLGMKLNHTSLARWAKRNFVCSFAALSNEAQFRYFTIYWFGSLFFFALVWIGASLLQ